MKVVIDIEANALFDPDKIWVIVCKDIDTGEYHVFRPETVPEDRRRFIEFDKGVSLYIGHNLLGYDWPVLERLLGIPIDVNRSLDTLIVSKLFDYPRSGHSVEHYGQEFGQEKIDWSDFSKWSPELETYCIRDVDITDRIYRKYLPYVRDPDYRECIALEHNFQLVVNQLHDNGFAFNVDKAKLLLEKVEGELAVIDTEMQEAFPPRLQLIREVTPRATKYGTISLSSIPVALRGDISSYTVDAPFSYCKWSEFNPSSHKQIISLLNQSGWNPVDKTDTHKETEREYNRLKFSNNRTEALDVRLKELYSKLLVLQKQGWKVNENNLETLPPSAPAPARLLSKRILLEARRRTLTEWIELVRDGRIHGKFYAIGAWTHRMAHQALIPQTSLTSLIRLVRRSRTERNSVLYGWLRVIVSLLDAMQKVFN